MRLAVAVLCDRATVREGLLHILGGGITLLGRPSLPALLDVDFALLLQPDNLSEIAGEHTMFVELSEEDGRTIARVELGYRVAVGDKAPEVFPTIPLAIPLRNISVGKYGRYSLAVSFEENEIFRMSFKVDKHLSAGATSSLGPTVSQSDE